MINAGAGTIGVSPQGEQWRVKRAKTLKGDARGRDAPATCGMIPSMRSPVPEFLAGADTLGGRCGCAEGFARFARPKYVLTADDDGFFLRSSTKMMTASGAISHGLRRVEIYRSIW